MGYSIEISKCDKFSALGRMMLKKFVSHNWLRPHKLHLLCSIEGDNVPILYELFFLLSKAKLASQLVRLKVLKTGVQWTSQAWETVLVANSSKWEESWSTQRKNHNLEKGLNSCTYEAQQYKPLLYPWTHLAPAEYYLYLIRSWNGLQVPLLKSE